MRGLWIRGVLYAIAAASLAQLSLLEAQHFEATDRFAELGYVELTQAAVLALLVLLLAVVDVRRDDPTPLFRCLALGFAVLFLRENDQVFEIWLPHGFWKWPALALMLWLVVEIVRGWSTLLGELRRHADSLAFGVLLAGFATLVFSRLFGRGAFWEAVMEERYWRPVKNAAEEGTELFALGLIALGVIELILRERRRDG